MSKSESIEFLAELEQVIERRIANPDDYSYTAKLVAEGVARVAQKVGEEATEVTIASVTDTTNLELANEAADLIYHLLVLLAVRELPLADVVGVLASRHEERRSV